MYCKQKNVMHIPNIQHYPTLGKTIGYFLWRKIFQANGRFRSWADQYFWGPSRGINEYDEIKDYKKSHAKPDKQYSILPTVVQMAGNCENKVVVDLGCGTGFFSIPFADKAKKVVGIDNSQSQLDLAVRHEHVEYVRGDIFVDTLPNGDIFIVPFVANYAPTLPVLEHFFQSMHRSLLPNGTIILVVDLPNNKELKRFGATKKLLGPLRDETKLQITLFNGNERICDLNATYFTPATIESLLTKVGFTQVAWHAPIVSDKGINVFGSHFWEGYIQEPELGYLKATKAASV